MNKVINRFSVWLYKKTRDKNIQQFQGFLENTTKIIESMYVPQGTCIFGVGERGEMLKMITDDEIMLNK